MFGRRVLLGVRSGSVSVVFRRWVSPEVAAHSRVRTEVGIVAVGAVSAVDPECLDEVDAARAGFSSAAGLRASLRRHGRGSVFRVEVEFVGPAAAEVVERVELSGVQRAELDRRLARWDVGSPRGPWTKGLLRLLWECSEVRAAELARRQQRPVSRVKSDVWKLGELGLVERRESGFRLSARGVAYVRDE